MTESKDTTPAGQAAHRKPRQASYKAFSSPPAQSNRPRLASAAAVAMACADIAQADREHFVVFDLDVRHRVIERRVVSIGTLTGVEVHPRETFRGAIANGAAAIVIAHNHPSGDASPSRQDIELTRRLRDVGEVCGIPVLDHLVIARGGWVSMASECIGGF